MEKDKYTDKSGDRKYFAMIPYYIVNHSTAYEQSLYLTMKRVASENGTCWASPSTLGKMMGVSSNTVRKYRQKLVDRKWIKQVGKRGITKPADEFEIVDLWELNMKFYAEKESSTGEQSKKKVQLVNLESSTGGNKEETIKKNYTTTKVVEGQKSFGNPEINSLIVMLKEKLGISELDGSIKQNRFSCFRLIKKYGVDKVKEAVGAAAEDGFWKNNATSFMKLERNINSIVKRSKDKPFVLDLRK